MQKIDNEVWKDIPGYEGLYEASDLGNVRSLNYNHTGKTKVMQPSLTRKGYLTLCLSKNGKQKQRLVHTLVITAFRGPIPPGMQVNHLNEIKTDNRLSNLEVCTPKQNNNWGTRIERAAKANKGRKHTPATKAKISASEKGKKVSAETRAKLSAAQKARYQREKNLSGITC